MRWLSAVVLLSCVAHAEDRVAAARKSKAPAIDQLFKAAGVAYPPGEIYLRAFKVERQLELWAGARGKPLSLVKTYAICAESGTLGPKREEGDGQIPEGFYEVSRFQPMSSFHLALGVDYPNAADRILGTHGKLGGDIMIHGNCVTVGCIPLQDDPIEEVYLIALDARSNGQKHIPVHIFPGRLDDKVGFPALMERVGADSPLLTFWRTLQPAYLTFEQIHRPTRFQVDPKTGQYRVDKGG
jgi:murein L,D-transpeptidase YafK